VGARTCDRCGDIGSGDITPSRGGVDRAGHAAGRLRPGLPFYVFAVAGDLDGEPMMARRYQDVWAISADPMPASLARGGKRTRSWALRFGLAGLALFAASALLLMRAGRPSG